MVCLAPAGVPRAATAAAIDDWFDDVRVVARLGDRYISTYDLALIIADERMEHGAELTAPPSLADYRSALARLFSQLVLSDAAERFGSAFPDALRIRQEGDSLLQHYGNGNEETFWRRTGIPFARIQEEVRRRLLVERYLQDTLLPQIHVVDDDVRELYQRDATAYGGMSFAAVKEQLRRLAVYERLRDELQRIRQRFLERTTIEILDERFTREDLTRSAMPENDPLKAIPPARSR